MCTLDSDCRTLEPCDKSQLFGDYTHHDSIICLRDLNPNFPRSISLDTTIWQYWRYKQNDRLWRTMSTTSQEIEDFIEFELDAHMNTCAAPCFGCFIYDYTASYRKSRPISNKISTLLTIPHEDFWNDYND